MIKREVQIGDCRLLLGDCLEIMPLLDKVDAVVTDPPYGTTGCKWDSVISLNKMWDNINNLTHDNSPIVLFSSQPFSSKLICSNIKKFKYEWIWQKNRGSNFLNLQYQPMKEHENILIFGDGVIQFFPIMERRRGGGLERHKHNYNKSSNNNKRDVYGKIVLNHTNHNGNNEMRYPSTVQKFNTETGLHPTQKPFLLLEYLINTYSKMGQKILDFTMGSGTTGVACAKLGRKFIGIELNEDYFNIACERIEKAYAQPDLFIEQPKQFKQQDIFEGTE